MRNTRSPMHEQLAVLALAFLPSLVGCVAEHADFETAESEENLTAGKPKPTGVSLVVKSEAPGLVPVQWHYGEVATREVWGCYDLDVLQGTGWYLAAFYRTYDFVAAAGGFEVDLERGPRARLCNAKMLPETTVTVRLDAPEGPIDGVFRVVPEGNSVFDRVTCTRSVFSFTNDQGKVVETPKLECSDAVLSVPKSGPMTVTLVLDDTTT